MVNSHKKVNYLGIWNINGPVLLDEVEIRDIIVESYWSLYNDSLDDLLLIG